MNKRKTKLNNLVKNGFLTPLKSDTSFDEIPKRKKIFKIYNDGGHYVATRKLTSIGPTCRKAKTELDNLFDLLYFQAVKNNMPKKEIPKYIKTEIVDTYCFAEDTPMLDEYIEKKIKVKLNNFYKRVKRFKRKANLNKWNYFVTFTYDNKLQDSQSFRKKLRKCLSNLHTRRGWKYMGVFELAPDTKRLHFHGLFYIPDGEMIGEIVELRDYSTSQHKMQISHSNTYFAGIFGRNDFVEINKTEMTITYILKYLHKTNEKIVYSRGIPAEIYKELNDIDIATVFEDFVIKYVLFDDVINWETDVMHFEYQQAKLVI